MRCITIFFAVFLMSVSAEAQNINGIWKGKLSVAAGGCMPVYNIEFQLQVAGTKLTGVSYHFSDTSNYVKENFEGIYKKDSNIISITETGVMTFHVPSDCIPCIKKYQLTYHRGDGANAEEQLRGSWSGRTMDGKSDCPPGTIVLTRFDKSSYKPEVRLPPTLTNRTAELVKEIKVDTGNIKIDFYDNGTIDGDTISVFNNGMPMVSRKMLTTKPISITVRIDAKHLEHELIMVGENLGTIPPNSALMIIYAGDKRYQLYLISDEKKNAMVRFIYEKPPIAGKTQ